MIQGLQDGREVKRPTYANESRPRVNQLLEQRVQCMDEVQNPIQHSETRRSSHNKLPIVGILALFVAEIIHCEYSFAAWPKPARYGFAIVYTSSMAMTQHASCPRPREIPQKEHQLPPMWQRAILVDLYLRSTGNFLRDLLAGRDLSVIGGDRRGWRLGRLRCAGVR